MSHPIIERCEQLYEDLSLEYVRAQTNATGRKAFGFMPVYFPREIVYASGLLPVGLMGAGDLLEIIKGDAYFQSYICHIPRSTVEMGLSGHLDCLSGMAFPAICDVIRNLSGMWKIMFPQKESIYFDVPQNFDPQIGGHYLVEELKQLAVRMSKISGKPVTHEALHAAIALYNTHREWVMKCYAQRSKKPWEVPTSELYLLMRAGLILDVQEHIEMMKAYLESVADLDRKPMDNARVVLTGSFCEQPPIGLIRSLERAGCYIVDDDWVLVHRWIKQAIPTQGDPYQNLADAYLNHSMDAPFKYQPERKGHQLKQSFIENRAAGVLFCAPSFCDPALLDRPMIQKFMEAEGIPYTSFKYAENTGQYQVIKEQAGTFSDSLKLWGEA
ncbi:MAG: benzoyl-CoA reductase subunit C [Acidobacteria bacterium]|nr:benzoyl-CoA reductase subunit C [Acidobacteriota bacterium]